MHPTPSGVNRFDKATKCNILYRFVVVNIKGKKCTWFLVTAHFFVFDPFNHKCASLVSFTYESPCYPDSHTYCNNNNSTQLLLVLHTYSATEPKLYWNSIAKPEASRSVCHRQVELQIGKKIDKLIRFDGPDVLLSSRTWSIFGGKGCLSCLHDSVTKCPSQ